MAEKRMFSKKITDSDAFIELSAPAQALYFHLNQGADDDGFNNQVQIAMLKSHASVDDLKLLMIKNFVIKFENGVIVIKHWRLHNTLRKDRYTPTNFQDELKSLSVKENGVYTQIPIKNQDENQSGNHLATTWQPSIDKNRLDKNSIDKISVEKKSKEKKSLDEVSTSLKNFEDEFEKLWKFYPNQQEKELAKESYIQARKDGTSYNDIANGLKNYINYIKNQKIDIKYVKYGSNWFKQKCWTNEYKITKKSEASNSQDEILKGVYNGQIKIN